MAAVTALKVSLVTAVHAKDAAKAALDDAQARFDIACVHAEGLTSRLKTYKANLKAKQAVLRAQAIRSFPEELLQRVFTFVAEAHSEDYFQRAGPESGSSSPLRNTDRALAPYHLRAVCRQWARIAYGTPELWTLFAVPDLVPISRNEALARRKRFLLQFHLERVLKYSAGRPLDVVIAYNRYQDTTERVAARTDEDTCTTEDFHDSEIYTCVLEVMLQDHIHRIRSISVCAPTPIVGGESGHWQGEKHPIVSGVLDLLRFPTPLLESVSLVTTDMLDHDLCTDHDWFEYPHQPLAVFLPYAPLLQRLSVGRFPLALCATHPGLPALRELWIAQQTMEESLLWSTLAAAPGLIEAHIDVVGFTSSIAFERLDTHPSLATLSLRGDGTHFLIQTGIQNQFAALNCPKLTSLTIDINMIGEPFAPEVLNSITHLTFTDADDGGAFLPSFRGCPNITHITIQSSNELDDKQFFDELCRKQPDGSPLIWPKLTSVTLNVVALVNSVEKDGLVRLVNARNSSLSESAVKITTVAIDTANTIPGYVERRLQLLLGKENVTSL